MTIDDKRLTEIEARASAAGHGNSDDNVALIERARTDIPDMAAEIRRLWAEREDAIAALNSDTIHIAELSAQVRPPRAQVVELKKQLDHYGDLYGQERDQRIAAEAREKRLREALVGAWTMRRDANTYRCCNCGMTAQNVSDIPHKETCALHGAALAAEEPQT